MSYRLFIAIDPPQAVRRKISSICRGPEYVRWMSEEQIHLTIRFIGEADGLLLDSICSELSKLEIRSFRLKVKGVGHFPPRGEPKVIWAGLTESASLIKMYGKISSSLAECGIKRESRKFAPHITLGRVRGGAAVEIARYLEAHHNFRSDSFGVNCFHLYTSRLTPEGAIHEKVASFMLDS